jgi:choline dehydrogenase-like flavoprotein
VDPETGRAGRRLRVRARAVVVACGTLHTPLLLWRSGLRHRNLGRRLTLHPALKISGWFPGEDFLSGSGVPQSYYVDQFWDRGIMMEGAHVPPDMASAGLPGKGREHKALMERYREIATYGFLVSDGPSGRVLRGLGGRPLLRYDLSARDHERMLFGLARLCELFVAAGAKELYLPTARLPVLPVEGEGSVAASFDARLRAAKIRPMDLELAAFHPLGTCGFGPDSAQFPLDCELRFRDTDSLWVADGSVFPSSLAVNPQLSIMAMATRAAWTVDGGLGTAG